VWQLAQHYHRSPEQLSDEELRQYFLYLTSEKKIARPTATIALCGIKFFYEQTLKQPRLTLRFVRPPREWKLQIAQLEPADALIAYFSRCFLTTTIECRRSARLKRNR